MGCRKCGRGGLPKIPPGPNLTPTWPKTARIRFLLSGFAVTKLLDLVHEPTNTHEYTKKWVTKTTLWSPTLFLLTQGLEGTADFPAFDFLQHVCQGFVVPLTKLFGRGLSPGIVGHP